MPLLKGRGSVKPMAGHLLRSALEPVRFKSKSRSVSLEQVLLNSKRLQAHVKQSHHFLVENVKTEQRVVISTCGILSQKETAGEDVP